MAPSELFVITSSSPADRRTVAPIKFLYHHVPSGLLQKQGTIYWLFGKMNLGMRGCHLPHSLSLVKSQNEMWKA